MVVGEMYKRISSVSSPLEYELEVVRYKHVLTVCKRSFHSVRDQLPDLIHELKFKEQPDTFFYTTIFTVEFGILGCRIKDTSIVKIIHVMGSDGKKQGEFWIKAEAIAPPHRESVGIIEPWKIQFTLPHEDETLPAHQLGYTIELDKTNHRIVRTVQITTDVDGVPEVGRTYLARPFHSKYFSKPHQQQLSRYCSLIFDGEGQPLDMHTNSEIFGKQMAYRAFELAGRESEWIENVLAAY